MKPKKVIVIGAGMGGLSTAALLTQAGYDVTVLEAHTYLGGCAGTFYHKGYHFDAGATVAGGFQPNGPMTMLAEQLGISWDIQQHDPAWVVHMPEYSIKLCQDQSDIRRQFAEANRFWNEQNLVADITWELAAKGLPFPPTNLRELMHLGWVGVGDIRQNVSLAPKAFGTMQAWLRKHDLQRNHSFMRLIDAMLLISAQTTSPYANSLYGATALDLPRQGVYHVAGGMGGLSQTLADTITNFGGEVQYRHRVTRLEQQNGRVTGVSYQQGRHTKTEGFMPCDFVVANLTPWSLKNLLGEAVPTSLQREIKHHTPTFGAFVLHAGIHEKLTQGIADHHQVIGDYEQPLGEGNSAYLSISPAWDKSRAPEGYRAVTISTHTKIQPWWTLLEQNEGEYAERKQQYMNRILALIERCIPGFRANIDVVLAGTPVTYQYYTQRQGGMVGGFPQTSLFKARGPRTGIPNTLLVGDSIFPGQSTAGVALGAMRVANLVKQKL